MTNSAHKPFSLSSVFLPEEMARTMTEKGKKNAPASKVRILRSKEPFVIIPQSHLELLAACKSSAAFAVYGVLYLTWCSSLRKYNPVKLNTGRLLQWRYHHKTIRRALDELEGCGLDPDAAVSSPYGVLRYKEALERERSD